MFKLIVKHTFLTPNRELIITYVNISAPVLQYDIRHVWKNEFFGSVFLCQKGYTS